MLELVRQGWSSYRFEVHDGPVSVAELSLRRVREGATLTVAGEPYELRREGLVSRSFVLARHGEELARASKASALRGQLEIRHGDATHQLVKSPWLGNTHELRRGGEAVGSVRPHHLFTRRAAITVPDDLPLAVTVFVAALVRIMRQREGAAAGGGAGGGGGG